ncbi:MAG: D-aminoacyl-tRNA deacylase [Bacteroidota bacterium]|nr:D-aminoacyl-tRNA deacylase [Bacteroidota bacterium]
MRAVIQRVQKASVEIDKKLKSEIKSGLLIFIGIEDSDIDEDINWLCKKISQIRIFDDQEGVMNLSVKDIDGEILAISQFTLHAKTKKGNRPSYIKAAKPDISIPLYKKFIATLSVNIGKDVKTGEFGADMKVSLINDGPVTIIIDTKDKDF